MAIISDAVALGCLKRKVRDSCTPRGKRSDLERKSTESLMNATLY
ncbi:hypothetical protein [Priestia koreensis]|nr:hypothetical protein [Priestia koreensis]